MKSKLSVGLSVFVLAALIFSACNKAEPAAQQTEAVTKDSVTIQVSSEWPTLDPKIGNDLLVFSIMYQFYDSLVRQEMDNTIVPALATSWELSEDGTEYTFKLREGVKFHNGETMTADDVVFSYERSVASPATSRITGTIDRIEKIDDLTVKVTLKYPYGPFLGCAAGINLGIVSKKAVEEMGEEAFARNPVGTGPYKFIEWRPGDRMTMESFPDYYRGEAAIKNVTFRIITDTATSTIALEKGEVDIVPTVAASEKRTIVNNPNLAYTETASASYHFVAFNMQDGIFTNKLLREAVSYAMDREAIVLGALEGEGIAVTTPFTPVCFGYPEGGFEANPYDPARARALLAEAGYPNGGVKITLRTMEGATYAKPGEIIQEQLRQVGFDCTLELMERGAFLSDAYTNSQFTIMFNGLTALVPDADMLTYTRFHSAHKGGGMNFTLVDMPEMDALLEVARKSLDPQERLDAYLKICELNREESIFVPLYTYMCGTGCNKNLKGVQASAVQKYFVYDWHWE